MIIIFYTIAFNSDNCEYYSKLDISPVRGRAGIEGAQKQAATGVEPHGHETRLRKPGLTKRRLVCII